MRIECVIFKNLKWSLKYRQEHNNLFIHINIQDSLPFTVVLSVVIPGVLSDTGIICFAVGNLKLKLCNKTSKAKKERPWNHTSEFDSAWARQSTPGSSPLMTFIVPHLGFVTRDLGVGVSSDCMIELSPSYTRMENSVKSSPIPKAQLQLASLQPIYWPFTKWLSPERYI